MGLLGSAFRVGSSVGRTTVRAGSSVARGRAPNISVGLGIKGFGGRIGTRGVSIRTPIASQSFGLRGGSTGLRIPGLASISVNPFRPSAVFSSPIGRLRLQKNSSLSIGSSLVAVGVSSKPMFWAHLGPIPVAISGTLKAPARPWPEVVDAQWKPHYQRRPPAVSEQLHELIRKIEREAVQPRAIVLPNMEVPEIEPRGISKSEVRKMKKLFRKSKKKQDPENLPADSFERWKHEETERLLDESKQESRTLNNLKQKWQEGDPLICSLVFLTIARANGLQCFVFDFTQHEALVGCFGPSLEDVHSHKPVTTPSGSLSIKKRSKAERENVWFQISEAQVRPVIQLCEFAFASGTNVRLLVLTPGRSAIFEKQVVSFELPFTVGNDESRKAGYQRLENFELPDGLELSDFLNSSHEFDENGLTLDDKALNTKGLGSLSLWRSLQKTLETIEQQVS